MKSIRIYVNDDQFERATELAKKRGAVRSAFYLKIFLAGLVYFEKEQKLAEEAYLQE